jgi:CHAT domain-containing protein
MMSDGELVNAEKLFLRESRGAIKTLQARWIDSICYYTMTGECYYQMGQLPEAMEQYTAAVELIVANADWMTRANLPANIPRAGPLNGKEVITWGTRRRKTILGKYPSHYMFRQGRLDNTQQYQQGGVVQKPMMIKVDVIEIVRCSALAIRRRMELLGPASKEDPLNGRLVTVLAKRPCIPNHWSECFIDVQLGLAQLATGKSTQGVATLKRSLSAAGQFEHPLTATALLELGRVTMKVNDLKTALGLFEEATFSAAFYGDIEVLQEAFRYATTVHVMTNGAKPYPALTLAEAWAQRNRFRKLGASLLISMADCEIALHQPGNIANAAKYLSDAAGVIGRHDMRGGYVGARLAMAQASVAFAGGKVSLGNESLAAAMQYMTHGSRWLYQIALIDQLYLEGTMTPRTAIEMYDDVLRDPTALDWMSNPMESLSVLLTPHVLAMEHWFEVALHRGETEKAIEIADRVRRHRFYSTLEFGGRLESLRWLFAGPDSALSDRDKIIRRDLLTRFPNYNALVQQSKQLVDSLRAGPIAPEETDAQATQRDILEKLRAVSLSQESVLREMAVGRTPTSLIFPPVLSTEKIQKQLPKGHALLIFLRTKRGYHAFLLNNERYTHWVLNSENLLRRDLMAFLRDLGQYDRNRELSFKDLTDDDWKKSSRKLLTSLLSSSKVDLSKSFKRLVVIPDGMLWYVPFEALQVKLGDETKSLIDLVEVTYAPTAAMAVSAGRGKAVNQRTGVVVGRLYPRDDEAVAKKQAEQLAEVLPEVTTIPTPLLTGSADYRMAMDRLIVFSDLDETGKVPYSWYPIPISPRFRAGSTLADWMTLPWGGPRTVILPGYHTAAESTLKGVNRLTAGDEIFLSICGLCASGADTVLISRWRTGGKTAYDMAREFAQELPHTTPAAAWQRAILLAREATLDPNEEPRVKKSKTEEPPTTNHPFFWASNILIYGEPMKKEEKKPEVKPADKSADKPAENPLEKPTPDSVRPPKIDPDFPLPDDEPKADDTKATGEEPAKEPAEEPAKEPEEPQTDF